MLLGRKAELGRIEGLLDLARDGHGGSLLLRGDPGIGKTSLLRAAAESAGPMTVIETSGFESEATLAFAALAELAAPILDLLPELPKPQRTALGAAVGLSAEPTPADRLAIYRGFTALLAAAAGDDGILVIVDDAHWLDPPSAACLAFVARRLEQQSVALLAASRSEEDPGHLGELPSFELGGLDREHAEALIRRADDSLDQRAVEALLNATLGNPLALIELPRMLSAGQRAGNEPLDPIPAPAGALGAAYARRLEGLDPEARRALGIAAAAFDRSAKPIVAGCRELGLADQALERCEADGLIELAGDRLSFAHPLLRSAAYESATLADRRAAHRALAAHSDPDPAAWHLAAAALGADEQAAGALELAGFRATQRGAHIAAADALERAAQLTGDGDPAQRFFAAGLAAALGGSFERAAGLLELACDSQLAPLRAMARHLLAMVRLTGGIGSALDNHRLLVSEAEDIEGQDPAEAASLFADAGVAAVIAADSGLALRTAQRAATLCPADAAPTIRCQVQSILGMSLALRARAAEAAEAFDRAGALLPEIELLSSAPQSIALALGGRVCTGQVAKLRNEVAELVELARERRSLGILPYLQVLQADAAYRLGDWDVTEAVTEEALQMAEVSGQVGPLALSLAVRARALAARGQSAPAREAAVRAIDIAEPTGKGAAMRWAQAALGFLELCDDRVDAALAELERSRQLARDADLIDPLIIPWAPDLVDAYARAGRAVDAAEVADELAERAELNGTALARALAARCQGIVAPASELAAFEAALPLHDEAEAQPFERARTLLAYGERLHRSRKRVEARRRLKEALACFEELGATPWARRARLELRAAGGLERDRVYGDDELTGQELRVARAVARGATNREVAAELYLSPKTIEFHLGRVYRKLNIHSRTELAALVTRGELDAEPAVSESAAVQPG